MHSDLVWEFALPDGSVLKNHISGYRSSYKPGGGHSDNAHAPSNWMGVAGSAGEVRTQWQPVGRSEVCTIRTLLLDIYGMIE